MSLATTLLFGLLKTPIVVSIILVVIGGLLIYLSFVFRGQKVLNPGLVKSGLLLIAIAILYWFVTSIVIDIFANIKLLVGLIAVVVLVGVGFLTFWKPKDSRRKKR